MSLEGETVDILQTLACLSVCGVYWGSHVWQSIGREAMQKDFLVLFKKKWSYFWYLHKWRTWHLTFNPQYVTITFVAHRMSLPGKTIIWVWAKHKAEDLLVFHVFIIESELKRWPTRSRAKPHMIVFRMFFVCFLLLLLLVACSFLVPELWRKIQCSKAK